MVGSGVLGCLGLQCVWWFVHVAPRTYLFKGVEKHTLEPLSGGLGVYRV